MYTVTVQPGVKLAVFDLNPRAGETVFFIHGWPVNQRMFEYQLDVLPALGFRCVSVDLRGFGVSDKPWDGYSYDRMADDMYEIIRSLRAPRLTLAGFSMGGAIAVRYMARHRGFGVSRLALLAAAAPSFVQRPGYPYGMTAQAVDRLIDQTYRDRPQMLTDFGRSFFASKISDSFSGWFHSLGLQAGGHSTIHTAESLRDSDLRADLARIRVPTGIFHGVLDQICPFAFAGELNRGIANSRIYRFEQSGHGIFYDELKKFNEEFVGFLKT